jgi:hypothetical protein
MTSPTTHTAEAATSRQATVLRFLEALAGEAAPGELLELLHLRFRSSSAASVRGLNSATFACRGERGSAPLLRGMTVAVS